MSDHLSLTFIPIHTECSIFSKSIDSGRYRRFQKLIEFDKIFCGDQQICLINSKCKMSNEQTAINIPGEINNLIEPAKNGNSSEAEQATDDVGWLK